MGWVRQKAAFAIYSSIRKRWWCLLFLKIKAVTSPRDFLLWIFGLSFKKKWPCSAVLLVPSHFLFWLANIFWCGSLTSDYRIYWHTASLGASFICHYCAFSAHKVVVPISIPLIWTHGKPKGRYHSIACTWKRYLLYRLTYHEGKVGFECVALLLVLADVFSILAVVCSKYYMKHFGYYNFNLCWWPF